ncbi:MAG: phage holin family protein [Actinomycetales bacterium]|nr:phage holin family protein [Actinomycetales bacterium]
MIRFLIGSAINAVGLWVAASLVPGIHFTSYFGNAGWQVALSYLLVGAVFGLVSTFIAPVIKVLAFPIYLLTFGLISFVINGALLLFVAWLSGLLGQQTLTIDGFTQTGLGVDSLGWAMLGAIIISIASMIASWVLRLLRIL